MVVKHEIKSQLAKLLATEDLVVEHKNVETAQFNVHTRVLQLPNWNTSNRVYDSLVAHEVGHALFTPDVDPPKSVPHTFMNIAEDVRIEKLMKRKYMGLAKTFYRGYNELSDNDFFEIDDKDVNLLNLADRVNLYFKIGSFVNISFSPTETPIVNLIKDAETFDEAVSAAEALYSFCKQEQEQEQPQQEEVGIGKDTSARKRTKKKLNLKSRKLKAMLGWILKGTGIVLISIVTILILPFLSLIVMLLWKVGVIAMLIIIGWMVLALL